MNIRILFFLLSIVLLNACVKTEFDEPPFIDNDPHLHATFSIKDLKALHRSDSFETVNEDRIIKAIVVADDRSGNYYRTIVVQDSTGGMEVKINGDGIFSDYPVGRRVYIKTKGLTLADYNNNFQVGQGTYLQNNDPDDRRLSGILPEMAGSILIKGSLRQPVVPKVRKISELTPADYNTLIQLDSVEFNSTEFGKMLADQNSSSSGTDRLLADCFGKSIIIRTSKYADFSRDTIPRGRGNVVAILSVFGSTKQLVLRERADMNLNGPRCSSGSGTEELMEIKALRQVFTGTTTSVPANTKIKGIIISDKDNNNITPKNIVLYQPGNAGIVVRFINNNTFALGDEVEISVGGSELSEFNGLLQVNGVSNDKAKLLSSGNNVTPQTVTLAEIEDNFENYESTLVKILNVSMSKSDGKYNGSVNLNDGTATSILYTDKNATFASSNIPAGKVSITGYVLQGGQQKTKEIAIRNLSDVQ